MNFEFLKQGTDQTFWWHTDEKGLRQLNIGSYLMLIGFVIIIYNLFFR